MKVEGYKLRGLIVGCKGNSNDPDTFVPLDATISAKYTKCQILYILVALPTATIKLRNVSGNALRNRNRCLQALEYFCAPA